MSRYMNNNAVVVVSLNCDSRAENPNSAVDLTPADQSPQDEKQFPASGDFNSYLPSWVTSGPNMPNSRGLRNGRTDD